MKIPQNYQKFVYESDIDEFSQIEKDRFEQPMNKRHAKLLYKTYGGKFWWTIDVNSDDSIDGYIIAGLDNQDGKLHVFSIAIKEDFEGKGHIRKLLEFVLNQAKDEAIEYIKLEVDENNQRALSLYEKRFGFKRMEKIPNYYGEGKHALKLELNILDWFR